MTKPKTIAEIRARLTNPPGDSSVRVMLTRLGSLGQMMTALVNEALWTDVELDALGLRSTVFARRKEKSVMIPGINAAMLAVSSSLAVSAVVKGTVATALGLIGARLARRSRAAVRHALLAGSFGVLLVLPAASVVAPPVRIAVPGLADARADARTVPPPSAGATGAITHAGVGVTPIVSRSGRLSPFALLLTVWMAGATLFLLPMLNGLWQVRSLRRSGLPWAQGQSAVERLAADAGMRGRVEMLLHRALPGPMICGVTRPAIVLPLDAQNWGEEDLNRAIVHELEHVRRRDWVSRCLARFVCTAYWFHPLVWMAWRQLNLEAERACDDAVLARSEATAYADQLVGLAQRISLVARKSATKSPLLAMANRADLAARVGAVLDSGQRRGRAGVLPVALACAGAAVLVLTMSPLRMVAAPQAANAGVRATTMPRFSANATLVIASVMVSDRNGKSMDGLKASDFAVSEDGKAQRISVFEFQKLPDTPPGPIESYYILGYYSPNPNLNSEFRTIRVSLPEDTGPTLRYRSGYYSNRSGGTGGGGVDNSTAADGSVPTLIYAPEPEYSEEARKAKFQGTVTLTVEVDASGQVTNTSVVRSLGLGLDQKALEAVQQWKFRPGMRDGKPASVQVQVDVNFRLL
jgi:TonB family protein